MTREDAVTRVGPNIGNEGLGNRIRIIVHLRPGDGCGLQIVLGVTLAIGAVKPFGRTQFGQILVGDP